MILHCEIPLFTGRHLVDSICITHRVFIIFLWFLTVCLCVCVCVCVCARARTSVIQIVDRVKFRCYRCSCGV